MNTLLRITLTVTGLAAAAFSAVAAEDAAPRSPERFLGRPVGTDFELADWDQVSGYMKELGRRSPRVQVESVGTTTEGREFLLSVISSEQNLARLDELKRLSGRIADPRSLSADEREQLLGDARVFLFISCNMHSTEIASPEMALELERIVPKVPT